MQRRMPIFYNALLLTGVNLLLRMVSTSFQVYLSGRIGAEGIGLLQLVLSVGGLAMTAGIAGVRTATMYLTAEELGKRRNGNVIWVLSGAFLYSILCSGLVAMLLSVFASPIAANWVGDVRTVDAIRLFSAFLPVSCLAGVMTGYFTAANRISTLAAIEVAEQGCSILCTMMMLALWAGENPTKACQSVICGSGIGALMTLLCLFFLRCKERNTTSARIPVAYRLANTAIPLALADDLKAGISTMENLMVPQRLALYHGTANPLALFGIVCGMVFPVMMFPAAILFGLTELLIPEMARCNAAGSDQRIHYLMHKSLRVALLYGTFCAGILFLIAPDLCLSLYGNTQAGRYLRWFAPLTVMLYLDIVTDAMIKGLGQQKASVRYNIFTSAMDVSFLYFLLPEYGIAGYYCSFLVTHAVNFMLSLRRLLKITGQRLSIQAPVFALLCGTFAVAVAGFLQLWYLCIAAYTVLFGCCLFLCKMICMDDIRWIRNIIRKR